MYSIDYFKKQQTQMKIGQVICIHGQYPCSLWYVKNIDDEYNSNSDDDYDASDDELENLMVTLYEVEYNGTEYCPKLNPPKIVQVYISNIKYNIISDTQIVCQFPSNYIQLYHSRRVVERVSRFGDMIQLKYYDAFMPFMIINYNPVDKAHFVMSLHTSRIFKTYHLILELSEFSTLSTKELRYSIITSSVNKGYSTELQKIDSTIEFKTRANYLFNIDKDMYDLEDFITKSTVLDESINIPTKSMEWYCHSNSGYDDNDDSTSDDDYTDTSVSPRLPIYIPMKAVNPVEIYCEDDNQEDLYEREYNGEKYNHDEYTDSYTDDQNDYDDYDEQYNHFNQADYEDDDEEKYNQYNQADYEDDDDEEKYNQYNQIDDEEQYNQADDEDNHEDYKDNTNLENHIEPENHIETENQYNKEEYKIHSEQKDIILDSPNQETNKNNEYQHKQKSQETYSFFTDDIINDLKSFFNEDAQKEIDDFLNDKEVIEAGNAIKHAVTEVISYLNISIPMEVTSIIIPEEHVVETEVILPNIPEEHEVETDLEDTIVINAEDINNTYINEAPTPCSIM